VDIGGHVEFSLAGQPGATTEVRNLTGVTASNGVLSADVSGFSLRPLDNGYLAARMFTHAFLFNSTTDLCVYPNADIYQP